jgi:DNA-binding beta-propeller fold protein YncE
MKERTMKLSQQLRFGKFCRARVVTKALALCGGCHLLLSAVALAQPPSAPHAVDTVPLNPLQIALLKWSPNLATRIRVGTAPSRIAFDGANIWVTNNASDNVTKLRANDAAVEGTFGVGHFPDGIAFDGANIWVVNRGDNTVSKLRARDGR